MYLLEPMCQRKFLIFMLCVLMNNKDLFVLIDWPVCVGEAGLAFGRLQEQQPCRNGSQRPADYLLG